MCLPSICRSVLFLTRFIINNHCHPLTVFRYCFNRTKGCVLDAIRIKCMHCKSLWIIGVWKMKITYNSQTHYLRLYSYMCDWFELWAKGGVCLQMVFTSFTWDCPKWETDTLTCNGGLSGYESHIEDCEPVTFRLLELQPAQSSDETQLPTE